MTSFRRLSQGGRIDRGRPLNFTFNGGKRQGFAGDTLASALLAANDIVVGRSFKYHRPRGVMGAGLEEPNALFTTGKGGTEEPNAIGPALELRDGLAARSQNAWPSPRFDLMAVNSLASPLFASGFYYKTFIGPFQKSWMFYEPFIRRAAGLGKTSYAADDVRHETRNAFCDVLVVGAGPAGLAAALAAARSGVSVVLAEQDFELGGQLLSGADAALEAWRAETVAALQAAENVRLLPRAVVQGIYDGNHAIISVGGTALESLRARSIIYAAGAVERPLVFENNDRPGVMLASALRSLANRFALVPSQRAVLLTNNDSAYEAAFDLAAHGVAVTVADLRREISGALMSRAAGQGIVVFPESGIAEVIAKPDVRAVKLSGRHAVTIECDVLGMSGGWSPLVHLTAHGGIKPRYDEAIAAFVPGAFASGHFAAGACNGVFGSRAAIASGDAAARAALGHLGRAKLPAAATLPEGEDLAYAITPVWNATQGSKGKAFVDFQNDVTAKDVAQAHDEGYSNIEHLKRYTTLGMGTDQGKTSNINALAIMAGLRGVGIGDVGTTTFRPPFTPLTVGAIAGRSVGHHFRPTRRSPLHDWHQKNGATFIEAGLWKRAWYYDWAGKTPQEAYVKEMELVRHNVGLSDVSTLGKIDVQGRDAGEFLNRVYVNGFAKLPVGKARYGVMLNDDGLVLDDGTTSRISETQYYLTTTTAQAGEVMSWLEFLAQCHWPELDVHLASLTDEWGGMSLAGPKAREALALALPGVDLSNEGLPYMGVKDITFEGVPVRLLRLSFSGELGYEIHCPANYTEALWEHLLKAAAPLGIKPYGLESLASLRIEKGHVAGLELDHRNSLDDLGLGKMASATKPFVGDVLRQREDMMAPERWSLVGLELLEAGKTLRGGSILFAANDEIKGHGRGYITSVTWSVELQRFIALGLYQGGLKHEGEEIICAFPLKNEQVKARIVSPMFIDSKGTRLHA
ncbi:MAG: (2Fe-2S)-binding protein [Alphaproteobacteria bacterium]|nr:(2Fe-2S)-binding protein [Alphaproteobacteria bacterium]